MSSKQQGTRGRTARGDRGAAPTRLGLVVFGALLVALFVIVAVAQGIGNPSVPSDAIAVVDGAPEGTVTKEEFDRALVQTAARQQLKDVPAPDDPQYQAIADAAESDLLLQRWVRGEAEERGIEVTDTEVDDELEKVKQQQFGGSEKQFQRFLDQSGYTLDEARARLELELISNEIQKEIVPTDPPVSDDEIQAYYDTNADQFKQPETRDVRVVLTKTEGEANQALDELGADPQPKDWEAVAKKYSIDEATKTTGGLRQGVVQGQSEAALDDQIFSAAQGELVGPFETDAGFYVIEVEKITPASTTSLSEASDQIRQTLVAARQQQIVSDFQADFQNEWTARTFCGEDYRIDQCSNAEPPPSACTEKLAESTGCDAVVPSTKPIAPGTAGVFGAPAPTGLPQGPITRPAAAAGAPGALPPGLTPTTPGAPPGAPPGTVPQGAAPTTPGG